MTRGTVLCGISFVAILLVIAETIGSARILQSQSHYWGFDETAALSSLISCPPATTAIMNASSTTTDNNDPNRAASTDNYTSQRRLEFVHIPKTGGTVIESEAARHNITWAICHFAHHEAAKLISLKETICPKGSLKYPWPQTPKYHQCPWWHIPPQYFELQGANPYAGADLFAVVRNVYDRIVSEYYYMGTYLTDKSADQLNDVGAFNRWLRTWLTRMCRMRRGDIGRNRTGNAPYFTNAGHWIPQYHFIYEHRRQVVKHVLRFEHLAEDFHALMKLYNLPLRLPEKKVRKSHDKQLGVWNMTLANLELIEMLYTDDFLAWGYAIMSEIIPPKTLERNEREAAGPNNKAAKPKKGSNLDLKAITARKKQ
mmetsp:Transcript_25476/g.42373  ORF Transcript_25476/g.42373 Transcript_25476/m.42373 type:complete len:370 (-) Transcript_25476:1793-2902(-)